MRSRRRLKKPKKRSRPRRRRSRRRSAAPGGDDQASDCAVCLSEIGDTPGYLQAPGELADEEVPARSGAWNGVPGGVIREQRGLCVHVDPAARSATMCRACLARLLQTPGDPGRCPMCRRAIREPAEDEDRAANEQLADELADTWGGAFADEDEQDEQEDGYDDGHEEDEHGDEDDHWAPRLATLTADEDGLGDRRVGVTTVASEDEVRRILEDARLGLDSTDLSPGQRAERSVARQRIENAPAGPLGDYDYAGWFGALVENYEDIVGDDDPVEALEDLGHLQADPLVALPGEMDRSVTAVGRAHDLGLPDDFTEALAELTEKALFVRIVEQGRIHDPELGQPGFPLSLDNAKDVLVNELADAVVSDSGRLRDDILHELQHLGGWGAIEQLVVPYGYEQLEPYQVDPLRNGEWGMG